MFQVLAPPPPMVMVPWYTPPPPIGYPPPPVVWCGRHPLALHIDVQTVLAAENVGKDVLVEYSNYTGNM